MFQVIDFEAPKKEKPRLPSSFLRSTSKSADINGRKKNGEALVNSKREVSSAGHLTTTGNEPKIMVSESCRNEEHSWKYSDESEVELESSVSIIRLIFLVSLMYCQ